MKKFFTFLFIVLALFFVSGCEKKQENEKKEPEESLSGDKVEEVEKKLQIIDEDSNSRPYAVVINNFPKAVKVQTGLQDAYLIYEFPVEGGMSRSLALYKDKQTAKIGTVRSARHNFLDYALENDAIFVHYGWSVYAKDDISKLKIDSINGLYHSPFWRENPEKLATEHTAYTSLVKVSEFASKKKIRTTTDVKPPLSYTTEVVDLSNDSSSKVANDIVVPYSSSYKVKFTYDKDTKRYVRYVNDKVHDDYFTDAEYTTKNILVLKIDYGKTDNDYYLELKNVGSGKGYYITNGYAKEITWKKDSRSSQTTYQYSDGSDVKISDGNTYIMFQSNNQKLTLS